MRVTFLESSHGIKLTKTISPTGSKSYPDVKAVNSHEYTIPNDPAWPITFSGLIAKHGQLGHCLLKGPLKRAAVNESRAGLGDRLAYADMLVLDIDNLKLPMVPKPPLLAFSVEQLAENILSTFGPEFTNVSYVAQASSSLGRKTDRISMHIYIMLAVPLPPKSIKLWLKHINLSVGLFKQQVELSSTGQSLKFPLDPSVADNTKLIFIAPPEFTAPGLDPFKSPADRIVAVTKVEHDLDLAALLTNVNPEKMFSDANEVKDELRDKSGLKKRAPKLTTVSIGGENLEVITNPDKMSISIVDDHSLPYVRCNINGGDSGGYYFNVEDPTYMYNFKDEPIFAIADADRDFHAAIFEKYKNNPSTPGAMRPVLPIVLRDFPTDTLYNGVFDPNSGRFSDTYPLTPTSAGAVEGFYRSHGHAPPSFVPDARVVFDPPNGDEKPNLESVPYYVNLYRPTRIQEEAIAPKTALEYSTGNDLAQVCPRIYTLIKHVCGDGTAEVAHFLNWLAFIYQKRTKAMTAWVFGGVPGTGKGLLVNRVLRPLFGEQHVTMKALENIEEQFNSFMRTAMFLVVDEFRMSDAKGGHGSSRIADKLKNQITEPTITIRSMRTNQVELPSFTNFIFLTNRQDAVRIEQGDRRYNVAPRQEKKLLDVHPAFVHDIEKLSSELLAFAGVLETFKVDVQKARTCIVNEAKETMKGISMSVFDDFCSGFTSGNLEAIIDVLDIELSNTFEANAILVAQRYVKAWIADAKDNRASYVTPDSMRIVYHVLNSNQQAMAVRQFSKMLARNGLAAVPQRAPGAKSVARVIKVTWKTLPDKLDEYIDSYFKPEDQALLPKQAKA